MSNNGDPRNNYLFRIGASASTFYDTNNGQPSASAALDLAGSGLRGDRFETATNSLKTLQEDKNAAAPRWGAGVMQNIGNFFGDVGENVSDVWQNELVDASPVFRTAEDVRSAVSYAGGRVWDNSGADSAASKFLEGIVLAGRGVATYQAAQNIVTAEGKTTDMLWGSTPDLDALLDSDTWKRAWESTDPELREATSPGRATADYLILTGLLGTPETQETIARGTLNPDDPGFQDYRATSTAYNIGTGATDVAYAFALAPEVLGFKALGGASKLAAGKTTLMDPARRYRFAQIMTTPVEELDSVGFRSTSLFDQAARRAGKRTEALRQTLKNSDDPLLYEKLSRMPFARHAAQGDTGSAAYVIERAAKLDDDETWRNVIRATVGDDQAARDALRYHADGELADAMDAINRPLIEARALVDQSNANLTTIDGWIDELEKAGDNTDFLQELKLTETGNYSDYSARMQSLQQDLAKSQEFDAIIRKAAGDAWDSGAPAGREGLLIDAPLTGRHSLREAMRRTYTWQPTTHASKAFTVRSHASRVWKRQPGVVDLTRGDGAVENMTAYLDQVERWAQRSMDDTWLDTRNGLLRNLGAAQTDVQRRAAVRAIENEAIHRIGRQHGLDWEDTNSVKKWLDDRRLAAAESLQDPAHRWSAAPSVKVDGTEIRGDMVDLGDGNGLQVMPIITPQLENWHTAIDLDTLNKFLKVHGEDVKGILRDPRAKRAADRVGTLTASALDRYNHIWKFSVLFRLGYPTRTVADDGMRTLAAGAGLATMLEAVHAPQTTQRFLRKMGRGGLGTEAGTRISRTADGRKVLVSEALSGPENTVYRKLASSDAAWGKFYDVYLDTMHKQRARTITSIPPERPARSGEGLLKNKGNYSKEWTRVVSDQLYMDPVTRRLLAGESHRSVGKWLRETPEGKDYLARNPQYLDGVSGGKTVEELVSTIDDHLFAMAPTQQVRDLLEKHFRDKTLAGDRKAMEASLDDILEKMDDADFSSMPVVNFEASGMITGMSDGAAAYTWMTSAIYNVIQKLPNDTLVRNPFFRSTYNRRLNEILGQYTYADLTEGVIKRAQRDANEYALGRLNRYLFSLNEETELLHLVRNMVPFGTAHIEALKKWGQVFLDNPAGAYRIWGLGWAGLGDLYFIDEVDKDGNPVTETDRMTNDSYLRFKVPEAMVRMLPALQGLYNEDGEVYGQIAKGSTNLVMQGQYPFIPSLGPVVQIPLGWWVKRHPEYATDEHGVTKKFFDYAFPIGLPRNWWDPAIATSANKVFATARDDPAFLSTEAQVVRQAVANFQQVNGRAPNKQEEVDLIRKAESQADWLRRYYFLGSMILPANIQYLPGDQEMIEQYRRLQKEDPATAFTKFVDKFGWESAVLGQSISTSVNGVPSTGIGEIDYQRNAKYIQDYPELGPILVSPLAFSDDYEQSVYRAQQDRPVGPGRPEAQRSLADPAGIIQESQTRVAWERYGELQDYVRAELTARFGEGASLNLKDAEDLRQLRQAGIADLAQKFPLWSEEYFQRDTGWGLKYVEESRALLQDLSADDPNFRTYMPWMSGLEMYIELHDYVTQELIKQRAAGGPSTLYAAGSGNLRPTQGSEQLAALWEAGIAKITQENPSFATHVYDRNLDGWAPIVGTG